LEDENIFDWFCFSEFKKDLLTHFFILISTINKKQKGVTYGEGV